MALLDSLIRDVGQRFGLGGNAAPFVAEVLREMLDSEQGGLPGFIERLKSRGLGKAAASWVAKGGENQPVTEAQLESALGTALLTRLSEPFSLSGTTIRSALVDAVPRLVDLLTPDGVIPDTIPADLQSFLHSASVRPAAWVGAFPEPEHSDGIGGWAWLLALLWAGLLAYWAFSGLSEGGAPKAVEQTQGVGDGARGVAGATRPADGSGISG